MDYYEVLGVNHNASKEEIKKAFRNMAMQFHSDKHTASPKSVRDSATLQYKKANDAYEVLIDDYKRAVYNRLRASRFTSSSSSSAHSSYGNGYGHGYSSNYTRSGGGGGYNSFVSKLKMAGRFVHNPFIAIGLLGIGVAAVAEVEYRMRKYYEKQQPQPQPQIRYVNLDEARKKLEEEARKAGYKDVDKYLSDRLKKDPAHLKLAAGLYKECVAEHGAENLKCKWYERYFSKCKAAIQGNQEEVQDHAPFLS